MDQNTLAIVREAIDAQAQGKSVGGKVSALTAEYLNRVAVENGGTFSAIFKEESDLSALEPLIQAFHVAAGERYPERSGKDWSNCFSSLNMALGRLCKKQTDSKAWMSYKPKAGEIAFKSKAIKSNSEETLREAFKAFIESPTVRKNESALQAAMTAYRKDTAETAMAYHAAGLQAAQEILEAA